jgi:hypothetical protein
MSRWSRRAGRAGRARRASPPPESRFPPLTEGPVNSRSRCSPGSPVRLSPPSATFPGSEGGCVARGSPLSRRGKLSLGGGRLFEYSRGEPPVSVSVGLGQPGGSTRSTFLLFGAVVRRIVTREQHHILPWTRTPATLAPFFFFPFPFIFTFGFVSARRLRSPPPILHRCRSNARVPNITCALLRRPGWKDTVAQVRHAERVRRGEVELGTRRPADFFLSLVCDRGNGWSVSVINYSKIVGWHSFTCKRRRSLQVL